MSSFLSGALGGLGGGAIGSAVVNLQLDSAKYQKDLAAAGAKGSAATSQMSTGFQKLQGIGVAAFAALGVAAFKFAADSVSAAIEKQAAEDRLTNSIKNSEQVTVDSTQAFLDQAEALRELTAVDDEAVVSAQALLVQMGLTEDQVIALTPRIVDLSEKLGIGLDTAAKAVGKAITGSTAGLRRMGIVVEDGTSQGERFRNTLEGLGAVLGFAEARAKAEPWRELRSEFEEMQEAIGGALLPILVETTPKVTELVKSISPALVVAFREAGEAVEPFLDTLTTYVGLIPQMIGETEDAADSTSGLSKAFDLVTKNPIVDAITFYNDTVLKAIGVTEEQTAAVVEGSTEADRYANRLVSGLIPSEEEVKAQVEKTNEALKDQQKEFQDLLTVSDDVWAELADQAEVSSKEILRAFTKQVKAQQDYSENLQTLVDMNLPDAMLQEIVDMGLGGAEVVDTLANQNATQWKRITDVWVQSGIISKAQAGIITDALNSIPSHKDIQLGVIIRPTLESGALAGYNSVIRDAILSELHRVQGT